MSDKINAKRIAVLVIIIAIVLAVAFFLNFAMSASDKGGSVIVLPEDSALPSQEPSAPISTDDSILNLDPQNVKNVIDTIARTTSYHRTLEISIGSGDQASVKTAEIWVCNDSQYFEITEGADIRHCLIVDGKVYVWYDEDKKDAYSYDYSDYYSADDLLGIPTYEDILKLDESQIISADYVSGSDGSRLGELYVEFLSEDGKYSERYWISLETGLLTEARSLYGGVVSTEDSGKKYNGGALVYSMAETQMELLPATDEAFTGRFTVPAS